MTPEVLTSHRRYYIDRIVFWTIFCVLFAAVMVIVVIPGIMLNVAPIQEWTLRKLHPSDGYAEVENKLGAPSHRESTHWSYTRTGLWTKVDVYFTDDGHFERYEIDW